LAVAGQRDRQQDKGDGAEKYRLKHEPLHYGPASSQNAACRHAHRQQQAGLYQDTQPDENDAAAYHRQRKCYGME
jgi:hypothetical protein